MHAHHDLPGQDLTAGLTGSRPVRVLWAEDNAQDRAFIQESLAGPATPDVTLVPDGVVLLAALRKGTPDLVVLDLKMPRLGGMEALRQIRADADLAPLRVIIFTSGDSPREVAQCRALGVVDLIV